MALLVLYRYGMELDRSILHLKFSRGVSADSAGRARDGGMGGGGGGGSG